MSSNQEEGRKLYEFVESILENGYEEFIRAGWTEDETEDSLFIPHQLKATLLFPLASFEFRELVAGFLSGKGGFRMGLREETGPAMEHMMRELDHGIPKLVELIKAKAQEETLTDAQLGCLELLLSFGPDSLEGGVL